MTRDDGRPDDGRPDDGRPDDDHGDGPPLVELASSPSTQEAARRLFADGAPHGALVLAHVQTAGRGRRGRTWLSGPHGLWLSMVVRAAMPLSRAARLPLVAADAVVGVLAARGVDARVKWPNDVLLPAATLFAATHATGDVRAGALADGPLGPYRKVGGLLLEVVDTMRGPGEGVALQGAVLGLGLNLRAPDGGFPDELRAIAGCLADVDANLVGAAADFAAVRRAWARALGSALAHALPADADDDTRFAAVVARLRRRSATLGRRVTVDSVVGLAMDIDDDGALLVRDDAGHVHVVRAGDVVLSPAAGPPCSTTRADWTYQAAEKAR
ncbi:MAG: biotin--[acetyl-CoA-carboxylase] ligase [Deltaproteobacteria bacterium]|nr:biotin--[acetyl-CoA-carboxylase] ligase [Deltaproteobacteria bacterium]